MGDDDLPLRCSRCGCFRKSGCRRCGVSGQEGY